MAVAPQAEFAQREFNALKYLKTSGKVLTDLKSQFPGARDVLRRACAYRVSEAEKRAAIVEGEETKRLQPEGFTVDEISDHPRVSQARRRVRHLKAIQKKDRR